MSGLQCFGADGSVLLDTNHSICRVVGTIGISGAGSVTVPNGRPWFAALMPTGYGFQESQFQFSISGQTISWSPYTTITMTVILIYGAY